MAGLRLKVEVVPDGWTSEVDLLISDGETDARDRLHACVNAGDVEKKAFAVSSSEQKDAKVVMRNHYRKKVSEKEETAKKEAAIEKEAVAAARA